MNKINNINEVNLIRSISKSKTVNQLQTEFNFMTTNEVSELLFDLYTRGLVVTTGSNNYKAKEHSLILCKKYKKTEEEKNFFQKYWMWIIGTISGIIFTLLKLLLPMK